MDSQMRYYLDPAHQDEAQRIADNSVATFRDRYSTLASEACYWRELVRQYSTVAFVPEPFEKVKTEFPTGSGNWIEEERLRGLPLEHALWRTELDQI